MASITSNHCYLSIDDFNQVAIACQNVSHDWEKLAMYLNIDRPTVLTIQKKRGGETTVWCLNRLITVWLHQSSPTQPKPSWRILCDAVSNIDRPLSEKIWTNHTSGCSLCRGVRPVATAVQQGDITIAAKTLSDLFDDLLKFLITEIRQIDVNQLRLCINKFFLHEEELNDQTEEHLLKIEDCPTPKAVLNYFVIHNFIGYINYSLIKVFQELAKSPLLDKRIEEYENDYQCFLKSSLSQIHDAFQQCPDLRPDYPAGTVPNYTIHLQSKWNGKSMFSLKEYLKHCFSDRDCIIVDQLMITKVSRNGGGGGGWVGVCGGDGGGITKKMQLMSKEHISDILDLDTDHSASLKASQVSCDVVHQTVAERNQLHDLRQTPVAMAVQQGNANTAAKELKNDFDDLLQFLIIEISRIDVNRLRYRISDYFEKEEGTIDEEIEKHLTKIEDCDKPSAVLNYFRRHRFIGYVNYSLIKVFQEIVKSPLLDKRIEEYEKDYQCFLELNLSQIHDAFQQCPDLRPDYPVGIPKFTIHLQSKWDGKSMFKLKEFLKQCINDSDCVDQLMIAKISRNCIIITFAVLPHITRKVLGYLTNDDVIISMKKEGISVDISKQLMKYEEELETTDSIASMEQTHETLQGLETDPSHSSHTTGILAINPDWDTAVTDISSGYSEGDSETNEYSRLVELKEDVTLKEAVDIYECVVTMSQNRIKSLENQLVTHKQMMMELDNTREQLVTHKQMIMELDNTRENQLVTHKQMMLMELDNTIGTDIEEDVYEAFERSIENKESVSYLMVQVIPFGPPHVGKTSLYRRLLDEKPYGTPTTCDQSGEGSSSTDILTEEKLIVQVKNESAKTIRIKDGCKWIELFNIEDQAAIFMKTAHAQLHQGSDQDSSTQDKPDEQPTTPSTVQPPKSSSVDEPTQLEEQPNVSPTIQPALDELLMNQTEEINAQLTAPSTHPPALSSVPVNVAEHHDENQLAAAKKIVNKIRNCKSVDLTSVQALLEDSPMIYFTDTGGQPEFHEILPALVAGPTVFLLAFSLHKSLDSSYEVHYKSSSADAKKYRNSFTVREVLMGCLSSISCFEAVQEQNLSHFSSGNAIDQEIGNAADESEFTELSKPPMSVLMVGTHYDLIARNDERLRKISESLYDELESSDLLNSIIAQYDSDERKLVIPIDNFNPEDGVELRKFFNDVVNSRVNPFKITLPVNWLGLELSLKILESATIKFDDCVNLGKEFHMQKQDVQKCLHFLHYKTGTIRYYGSSVPELEGVVVIKPRVIFAAVTKFITCTFSSRNVSQKAIDDFKYYGLFKMKDIEAVFNAHEKELEINLKQFLALLKHLNILSEWQQQHAGNENEANYFFPCALTHIERNDEVDDKSDPLLLSFNGGFLPKGVFSGILAIAFKKWKISKRKNKPELYRNRAIFYLTPNNSTITIKATAKYLELSQECLEDDSPNVLSIEILAELSRGLKDACKKLGYRNKFCDWKFGFYCCKSLTTCCDSDDRHFAEISDNGHLRCSRTAKSFKFNHERQQWLEGIKKINTHIGEKIVQEDCEKIQQQDKPIVSILKETADDSVSSGQDEHDSALNTHQEVQIFISQETKIQELKLTSSADINHPATLQHKIASLPPQINDQHDKNDPLSHDETIFHLLKPKSAKWKEIGRESGIDLEYCETLYHNVSITDESKLEIIIALWKEKNLITSWNSFIAVMRKLNFYDVIQNLEEHIIGIKHPTPHVTVEDLQEQLHNLTDWELFATHLPGIDQYDVTKISRDYHGVDRQKLELYKVWLRKCANTSWDHVINALEKNNHNRLVADIKQWLKTNRGKVHGNKPNFTNNGPIPPQANGHTSNGLKLEDYESSDEEEGGANGGGTTQGKSQATIPAIKTNDVNSTTTIPTAQVVTVNVPATKTKTTSQAATPTNSADNCEQPYIKQKPVDPQISKFTTNLYFYIIGVLVLIIAVLGVILLKM